MPQKKREETKPKESLILIDEDKQALEAPPAPADFQMAAYEPRSFAQALEFAGMLCQSKIVPEHLQQDPGAVLVIMARSRALDIHWSVGFQEIYHVYGRLAYSANLISALCQTDPEFEFFDVVECDDTHATVEAKKKRWTEAKQYTVTIDEAKKAGYLDGKHSAVWKARPKIMLGHMASREAGRLWNKARMMGIYAPEELEREVVDVTPAAPELAPVIQGPSESKADALVREKKAEEVANGKADEIAIAIGEALGESTDEKLDKLKTLIEDTRWGSLEELVTAGANGNPEARELLGDEVTNRLKDLIKETTGFNEAIDNAIMEKAKKELEKPKRKRKAKPKKEPEERFQGPQVPSEAVEDLTPPEDGPELMSEPHKAEIYALLTTAGNGDKTMRMYLKGLLVTYLGAHPVFLEVNDGVGFKKLEEVPDSLFEAVRDHVRDHIAPKATEGQ